MSYRSRWRLTYGDDTSKIVTVFPPLNRAEVLERFPVAIDATPLTAAEEAKLAFDAEAARAHRIWALNRR
jgi:hypothetical protein